MSDSKVSRVKSLYAEIRCPVCEGQSVADSETILAQDLRHVIGKMVSEKKTDGEIRQFLVHRYGDEILLRPQLSWDTLALWGVPVALLIVMLGALFHRVLK